MKFSEILNKVADGATFSVNYEKREFRLNGKVIDIAQESQICTYKVPLSKAIEELEYFYDLYAKSVPTERSDRKKRSHFVPYKELTDDDFLYGDSREVAECNLELLLLTFIINGSFTWDKTILGEKASFCWRSKNYPSFVILRKWIEPQDKPVRYTPTTYNGVNL